MASNASNIVSRLATRFSNATGGNEGREKPDFLTRDIGGHFRNNQPYISGYFQVIFGLPSELLGGDDQAAEASKWLHSTCEGFTPHTQALTKVDVMGQGQIGSSFVANVTTTREFTCTYREYQNQPILNIFRRWGSVFDPFTGVSPLQGNHFIPLNYKGWACVVQTKPVGARNVALTHDDIEEAYIYQGVFPTTIPVDTAGAEDITANDTVQHSVTFSFDGAPLTTAEPGVIDQAVKLMADMHMLGDASQDNATTYSRYHDNGSGADGSKLNQWGTHSGEQNTFAGSTGDGTTDGVPPTME